MTTTESTGDCGYVAATMALSPDAPLTTRLVHGHPIGLGGDAAGLRYWHAWVEVTIGGRTFVVDHSNGLEATVRRTDYYRLGRITDVTRYTPAEAAALMAEYGHYGPWDGTIAPVNQ